MPASAGWDLSSFRASLFCMTKGMMNLFDVSAHGVFIWPVVFTMPDVPSLRNTLGWHLSIFPWYINCGGKYSPANVAASTAVIWCLSSELVLGITFSPALYIVHCPLGTRWRAVWSQLMMTSSSHIPSVSREILPRFLWCVCDHHGNWVLSHLLLI